MSWLKHPFTGEILLVFSFWGNTISLKLDNSKNISLALLLDISVHLETLLKKDKSLSGQGQYFKVVQGSSETGVAWAVKKSVMLWRVSTLYRSGNEKFDVWFHKKKDNIWMGLQCFLHLQDSHVLSWHYWNLVIFLVFFPGEIISCVLCFKEIEDNWKQKEILFHHSVCTNLAYSRGLIWFQMKFKVLNGLHIKCKFQYCTNSDISEMSEWF